jgi:aminoglycoside 3-N-acetyltransferase
LENGLGEGSPLRKLYDLDAKVLFIGTSYETNTCFHLAEYRSCTREVIQKGAPILIEEERRWVEYTDIEYDDTEFETIGIGFEQQYPIKKGKIGSADSKLFSLCEAVDYAEEFFKNEAKLSSM